MYKHDNSERIQGTHQKLGGSLPGTRDSDQPVQGGTGAAHSCQSLWNVGIWHGGPYAWNVRIRSVGCRQRAAFLPAGPVRHEAFLLLSDRRGRTALRHHHPKDYGAAGISEGTERGNAADLSDPDLWSRRGYLFQRREKTPSRTLSDLEGWESHHKALLETRVSSRREQIPGRLGGWDS